MVRDLAIDNFVLSRISNDLKQDYRNTVEVETAHNQSVFTLNIPDVRPHIISDVIFSLLPKPRQTQTERNVIESQVNRSIQQIRPTKTFYEMFDSFVLKRQFPSRFEPVVRSGNEILLAKIVSAQAVQESIRLKEQFTQEESKMAEIQAEGRRLGLTTAELFPKEEIIEEVIEAPTIYYFWSPFKIMTDPNRPNLIFPNVQKFQQGALSDKSVSDLKNTGWLVMKADFTLSGTPLQIGIDKMNKIARRNMGIKAVNVG